MNLGNQVRRIDYNRLAAAPLLCSDANYRALALSDSHQTAPLSLIGLKKRRRVAVLELAGVTTEQTDVCSNSFQIRMQAVRHAMLSHHTIRF